MHDECGRVATVVGNRGWRHLGVMQHPAQLETINTLFSPSEEELEYARQVVAAFAEAEAEGRGSTSLDGKMIDIPVVKRARNLLALADAMAKSAG